MLRPYRPLITAAICLVFLAVGHTGTAWAASLFATEVVSYSPPLGSSPYDDPASLLGQPATEVYDPGWPPHVPPGTIRPSMAYAAWNTDPSGNKLITTIGNSQNTGEIVVKFDHRVEDHPWNWYGYDFIVFGNGFLTGNGWVTGTTNMEEYTLTGGGWFEEVTVSVSPDNVQWYTYSSGPYGDGPWPLNPYAWDYENDTWGEQLDFTKPVDPQFAVSDVGGQTVAWVIDNIYLGSAGGTPFDLSESGFSYIEYVKFNSNGGEIDAVSDVGWDPALTPEPGGVAILAAALLGLAWRRRRT